MTEPKRRNLVHPLFDLYFTTMKTHEANGVEWVYPEPIEALMSGVSGIKKMGDTAFLIYTDQTSSARMWNEPLANFRSFFDAVGKLQDAPSA